MQGLKKVISAPDPEIISWILDRDFVRSRQIRLKFGDTGQRARDILLGLEQLELIERVNPGEKRLLWRIK